MTHTCTRGSCQQHPHNKEIFTPKANSQDDSTRINPDRTPTHKSTPEIRVVGSLNRNAPEKDTQRDRSSHTHAHTPVSHPDKYSPFQGHFPWPLMQRTLAELGACSLGVPGFLWLGAGWRARGLGVTLLGLPSTPLQSQVPCAFPRYPRSFLPDHYQAESPKSLQGHGGPSCSFWMGGITSCRPAPRASSDMRQQAGWGPSWELQCLVLHPTSRPASFQCWELSLQYSASLVPGVPDSARLWGAVQVCF